MPKFIIQHADGTPVDPEARYFVLRVDGAGNPKRDAARSAVLDFARYVRPFDPEAASAAERVISGVTANVSPDASPDTLAAIGEMARLASQPTRYEPGLPRY